MKPSFVVIGIILVGLGIAAYYITSQTNLIGGRTHSTYPLGGIGLAVLGALIAAGGVMMGKAGANTAGPVQWCKSGMTFRAHISLGQHSQRKNNKKTNPPPQTAKRPSFCWPPGRAFFPF